MEVRLRCPACGEHLTVPDPGDSVVQTVECPKCSMEIPFAPTTGGQPAHSEPPKKPVPKVTPVQFDRQRGALNDEMDMTPMVDVTFLLLIFFMVTAAFSLQRSFEVPAPDQTQPSTPKKTLDDFDDDPDFIVIRIDEYSTFRVGTAEWEEEAPSEHELMVRLREAKRGNSRGVVPTQLLVVAHGDAFYEKVVTALDAGTAVGMEQVKMVTVEEDQ